MPMPITTPLTMMNPKNAFIIFILLELIVIVVAVIFYDFTLEALHTTTRFSGRLSLLFFSLIFLLKDRNAKSHLFISDNPYLLFAILHGIHLAELLCFVTLSGTTLVPIRVLGGFVAYLFIFIMPILVWMLETGRLSTKIFKRYEMFFLTYIWFIFFMAYLPRILGKLPNVGGTFTEHVLLFSWVILIAVLRVSSQLKFSRLGNV
jgi:hypothetical protein